jgi:phosphate-selective porin OprO/OprP
MADYVFFSHVDDNLGPATGGTFDSGFFFRRAWLMLNGRAFDHVTWMAQYAFDTQTINGPGFLDVWVGLEDLDECFGCHVPNVRIGHYQEPFGLAWLTSSKYFQLMAWPTPTTSFTPGYSSGVEFANTYWGNRVTLRGGFFGHADNLAGIHNWTDGWGATGRITWTPWAPCDCDCRVFHLGLSASYRGDLRVARFRTRGDMDWGPLLVDTGPFAASEALLADFEVALVYDRFNVQGELMLAQTDADTGTDPFFWGAYLQAGYQLSGTPCRTYNKKYGTFGAAKVCEPFLSNGCCGKGAWEIAARVSRVDMDDGDKQGGQVLDVVVGLNWYLNANARIMFNYVWADLENAHGSRNVPDSDGQLGAFMTRFQVHW